MPIPIPARLPFSATSAWASRISERISSGTWVVRSWTRAPSVGSVPLGVVADGGFGHTRRVAIPGCLKPVVDAPVGPSYPTRRLRSVAGRIREEDIAEVREKARIDDVISAYVTLRNAGGGNMKGLCPFHDEKSPSFNVTPARGLFHCFGCGVGGDVIKFVMEMDGLGFTETVERLAEKVGVQLRYEEGGPARPRGGPAAAAADRGPQGDGRVVRRAAGHARGTHRPAVPRLARLRRRRGRPLRGRVLAARGRGAAQAPAAEGLHRRGDGDLGADRPGARALRPLPRAG